MKLHFGNFLKAVLKIRATKYCNLKDRALLSHRSIYKDLSGLV